MARDIAGDIRLDPRVKAFLADDEGGPGGDVDSREPLLAEANSEEARAGTESFRQFMEQFDTEEAAPSPGLRIHAEKVISQPDGNTINLQVIRPDNDATLPCVYYIHGGGMGYLSCFDCMYRGWGKLVAANGVAVVMVDFRNAVVPSSAPEVAPSRPA
jgi:acetyl esterase/lipase